MELTGYQKKALDYSKHISLTANAGSGKTFILSKRYVTIACEENINLNNIVAITFTEKAASELYKRISNEIEDRLSSVTDLQERKKLSNIRRQLVSANISTIHSFCINILKEFPLEAGIDANFSPIDPLMSRELIELSINEFLNHSLNQNNNDELKELLRIFGSKSNFTNQIFRLIEKRKKIVEVSEKLYSNSIEYIANYLHQQFDEFYIKILTDGFSEFQNTLKLINDEVINDKPDNTIGIEVNFLLQKLGNSNLTDEIAKTLKEISKNILTSSGTFRKTKYLKKQLLEELAPEIKIVEEYLEKMNYFEISDDRIEREKDLAVFGKNLVTVFNKISSIYENKKKQNGYLDFEDLLLLAKKVLADENVRLKLGEKFKYIMIDEYQDTNEIQYEIFMPILNNLKQGNLFVVGDEKQSIYKFREADLELFNRTKNDIKNEGSENNLLLLPHSFRVSPPVALFANKLFEKLFESPNLNYNEVGASDLICASKDKPGSIEVLFANKEEGISEAEFVAQKIVELLNSESKIDLRDIAILCRKRNSFTELEEVFSEVNLPYKIVGGKGFYQQQLIFDIYNYLFFLTNQDDDISLVGLLRSPFYNLADTDLIKINNSKGNTFWQKLNNYSSENAGLYSNFINRITANISMVTKIDISQIIRKILTESGYWSIISSSKEAEQDIANLEKLIRIANGFNAKSYKTVFDFLEYLKESMESYTDEGQASVDMNNNAIQIMTIHQSKGLEFKAVFIYNCNDISSNDKIKSKTIGVDNNFGLLTKLPPAGNYFRKYEAAPIVSMFDFIEEKKELAEVKRLLYVAVTRAVNYLFISARKDKSLRKKSFIELIVNGLNIDPDEIIYRLSGELKFLQDADTDVAEFMELDIPINQSVNSRNTYTNTSFGKELQKSNLSGNIFDYAKKEIISATKVAVFSQCQRKYELTYEYGYSKLFMKFYDLINKYEFQSKEEDNSGSLGAVKGRVIHRILEKEIDHSEIEEFSGEFIAEEVNTLTINQNEINKLTSAVSNDLVSYYNSNCFKFLKSLSDHHNEFEAYTQENENYLYGIIDRLAFSEDKAYIIDYKTDEIEKEEIKERGEIYSPQLKFYAYLISKLYPELKTFELRLVFIKYPDNNFVIELPKSEVREFQKVIENYINAVKNRCFNINTKHCHKCYFFLNKKICIYDQVNN